MSAVGLTLIAGRLIARFALSGPATAAISRPQWEGWRAGVGGPCDRPLYVTTVVQTVAPEVVSRLSARVVDRLYPSVDWPLDNLIADKLLFYQHHAIQSHDCGLGRLVEFRLILAIVRFNTSL